MSEIHHADCLEWLSNNRFEADLTFLDPPFNQGRTYRTFDDRQDPSQYWTWIENILSATFKQTSKGGAVYVMQRDKNTEHVLKALRRTGWVYQNLVIWKKLASAVPSTLRHGKQYQIIALATKGERPRVFNRLRIAAPFEPYYKISRGSGVYLTDIWSDIRELTSGYFAGQEPVRDSSGHRFHKQQSPLALLIRIILCSSLPRDTLFDPFSGTGTSLVAAKHLRRKFVGIENDAENVVCAQNRIASTHPYSVNKYYADYRFTENLPSIWGSDPNGIPTGNPIQTLPFDT